VNTKIQYGCAIFLALGGVSLAMVAGAIIDNQPALSGGLIALSYFWLNLSLQILKGIGK